MENIFFKKREHVAIVSINHPPANTWDLKTMEEFGQVVDQVENDPEFRVMIITGSGERFFSAGFDVKDAANTPKISPMGRSIWKQIDRFSKPVIAAINGTALGGGFELALACHFRFMTDSPEAVIGLTELNLGIIPGWGGTQRMANLIGYNNAQEMILLSKTISPEQALKIGLVYQVCPPDLLIDIALIFAQNLAKRPPIAVACVLKAMSAGKYEGIDQGLKIEEQGSLYVRNTEDCNEGFTAFLEKRDPVFKGV
ncbi:MAG: enoyl-CoA hydratase [Deltaproteobacteria bacterium]|nr:enoyl-CoA hydratase [Deltaproteobacteria bacterium]